MKLQEIEPKNVAVEEYNLSIEALSNNRKYMKGHVNIISSYLPMNLPLYSLILYVVVPRVLAQKCNYRPSAKVVFQSKKIHRLLGLEKFNIYLFEGTRYDYFNNYVISSDVVIFVGKPENADKISKKLLKKTMFLYFGVGQNPVVLTENANIKLASPKIAEAIMFNCGQDCAKPNIIICHRDNYPIFLKKIIYEIEKCDHYRMNINDVKALKKTANLLADNIEHIVYGGTVDFKNKIINPVIITKKLSEDLNVYEEYYAPVFRIMLYEKNDELKQYFFNKRYSDENMVISLFGSSSFIEKISASIILHNKMVSEIDNGYCEYGGYGHNTSYLLYYGIKIIKPILINREIEYFFNNDFFINNAKCTNSLLPLRNLNNLIYIEVERYIKSLFGNNLLFSFVFGSHAKNNASLTSDIDIFVCLKEKDSCQEKKFREWYFKLHYLYGKKPDFFYPGEIITESRLNFIVSKAQNIKLKFENNSRIYDTLFYTQIFTDKKRNVIGDEKLLLEYEQIFKNNVDYFCKLIYNFLKDNNLIKNDREHMKCLMALANNDLLFLSLKLRYKPTKVNYIKILKKLDDGFLIKYLMKK